MNIPNVITVIRIILVPFLVIFLIEDQFDLALLVFIAAGISDAADGFLARLLNQRTTIGAFIDPVADKLLINTSIVTLAILDIMPSWLAVLVISRDVIILLGVGLLELTDRLREINPTIDSKITTFFQLACIFIYLASERVPDLLRWDLHVLTATAVATIISGLHYIFIGFQVLGRGNNNRNGT